VFLEEQPQPVDSPNTENRAIQRGTHSSKNSPSPWTCQIELFREKSFHKFFRKVLDFSKNNEPVVDSLQATIF